jgi:hypothetical protein
MDRFEEFKEFLGNLGFEGVVGEKKDKLTGCAIFWKKDKIKLIGETQNVFYGGNTIYSQSP